MQTFWSIPAGETLVNSRQKLLDNANSIMSCFSGGTAPSNNLQVGMLFLNTSTMQLFQLKDLTPNWKLIFDLNKTATNQEYIDTGLATKVDKVSASRPGVTKLYRNDNDSAYNVQTSWDSTYWLLQGYSGDSYHSGCRVARADSVDWSGVANKPSTYNPPIATASILGGVKAGTGVVIAGDGTISVSGVPTGVIVMWSGSIGTIPSGWQICNGTSGTPDLRDRFIVGAGNSYAVGAAGGEAAHTLTIAEMPSHTHTTGQTLGGSSCYDFITGYTMAKTSGTGATGGGGAHNNLPPYYALCYIMKL